MASNKPVPSRAAVNALRGLAFTTSCTVILLAEERRRRLKIAQAAVDNAKKLHTARNNRRAAALADQLIWDDGAVDPNYDIRATLHLPHRRRKRSSTNSNDDFRVSPRLDNNNGKPRREHARDQPVGRVNDQSSHDFIREATATLSISTRDRGSQIAQLKSVKAPYYSTQFQRNAEILSRAAEVGSVVTRNDRTPGPSHLTQRPASLREDRSLQHTISAAEDYLNSSDSSLNSVTSGAIILEQFIQTLQPGMSSDYEIEQSMQTIARLLQSKAFDSPNIQGLLGDKDCLAIWQAFARYAPNQMEKVYPPILRCCHDMTALNVAFFSWLQSGEVDNQSMTKAFASLNQIPVAHENTDQYPSHLAVAKMAIGVGDWSIAKSEVELMARANIEQASQDMEVLQRVILEASKAEGTAQDIPQDLMALICDIYAQDHTPMDNKRFIKAFVEKKGMKVCQRWIGDILEWHFNHNAGHYAFWWLQFCLANHIHLSELAFEQTFARCEKYWQWSLKKDPMRSLYKRLQATGIELPEYKNFGVKQASGQISKSARIHQHQQGGLKKGRSAQKFPLMPTLAACTWTNLKQMQQEDDWVGILRAYGEYCSWGGTFSAPCLKVAVQAHLELSKSQGIARASKLIEEAFSVGYDVSSAMAVLLAAQIQRGAEPYQLLSDTLDRGIKVDRMVFNTAFSVLAGRGNKLDDCLQICQLAAKHCGNNKLAFDETNFSNLLYTYVGLGSGFNAQLYELLSHFVEQEDHWQGSKICKEAVKLAMKCLAKRPVLLDEHERLVYKADEVLCHIIHCRNKHQAEKQSNATQGSGGKITQEQLQTGYDSQKNSHSNVSIESRMKVVSASHG